MAGTRAIDRLRPPADGAQTAYDEAFFDAILVVSFGGPEGPDDVMPFLENVTRGRGVPRERLEEVARHYRRFGGVSPINGQNRALLEALRTELDEHGIDLPLYLGNRNWDPLLPATLERMAEDGVRRAMALFTSAYSSYSGCRQYREDLYEAQLLVGARAPEVVKLRAFYNHPGFIQANTGLLSEALADLGPQQRSRTHVAFCAHSIPEAMADGCAYSTQLEETAELVADQAGVQHYAVVYQSRSGPPRVPWLEPDICDHLETMPEQGIETVAIAPVGFLSDHMEVIFDLDVEAVETGRRLALDVRRVPTVGTDPRFVSMIRELVQERLDPAIPRRALGSRGPRDDTCLAACCLPGTGRPSPWAAPGAGLEAARGVRR